NEERDKLDKYLEKKNDEKCKEEANQTIINYISSRRKFISPKLETMLDGILIRNRFSVFIDGILEKVLSMWEKLPDEKKLEEEANKIWEQLRDRVSAENEDLIKEEIDNIVNDEYGTIDMWASDFLKNYEIGIIPELSKINAIRNVSSTDFLEERIKEEIDILVEQILLDVKRFNPRFNPRVVRNLKDEIETKLNGLSTKFNVKFDPNFEMNVH
ncbi:18085_t:CDS:1, partial [Racocetra persica]